MPLDTSVVGMVVVGAVLDVVVVVTNVFSHSTSFSLVSFKSCFVEVNSDVRELKSDVTLLSCDVILCTCDVSRLTEVLHVCCVCVSVSDVYV